jgi:hypothetical protein
MFRIRERTMDAFTHAAVRAFEDEMLDHMSHCFPNELATLGEDAARDFVRRGIERAHGYRIDSALDVCKFIDLMLVFGDDFDRECDWARDILDARALQVTAAGVAMARLFERAMEEA